MRELMKNGLMLLCLLVVIHVQLFAQVGGTELLILGSDHFSQVYKANNTNTDVLSPKGHQAVEAFNSLVARYQPDLIMIEELPEMQLKTDSLYQLYLQNRLDLKSLPDGRSEVYNIAFALGKTLNLPKIVCVNAPGATSQGLLDNGTNIELYKNETAELRKMVGSKYAALGSGELSFKDYLYFLNQPEAYNKIYHLRYITPARVTNGTFKNPDAMVDTAFINPKYIGAELTSVWKNRDYKIYSNIVTTQLQQKPKKMLLLIGVAHVGSLRSIFRDDPEFNLIDASAYLE